MTMPESKRRETSLSAEYRIRDTNRDDLETLLAFTLQEVYEAEGTQKDVDGVRRGVEGAFQDPARSAYWIVETPDGRAVASTSIVTEWSDFHGGETGGSRASSSRPTTRAGTGRAHARLPCHDGQGWRRAGIAIVRAQFERARLPRVPALRVHDRAVYDHVSETPMTNATDRCRAFHELHASGIFVIPNPWDVGSARALDRARLRALATTSSGFAWSVGRADNAVTLEQALEHFRAIADACRSQSNADFEGGFAVEPDEVADNVAAARCARGSRGSRSRTRPAMRTSRCSTSGSRSSASAPRGARSTPAGRRVLLTGDPKASSPAVRISMRRFAA